jgi:hypothetical protein
MEAVIGRQYFVHLCSMKNSKNLRRNESTVHFCGVIGWVNQLSHIEA